MPKKTPTYNLDYLRRGEFYSASADFRRFTTLDYNMESFVGISGNGVINGWTQEQVSGLIIKILPGKGIIDGYSAESPYTVKKRSEMVDGDREIEIFDETGVQQSDLTTSERAIYVSVVQLYNPTYSPVGSIVNEYVKIVIPSQLTLSDNADNYIFAKLPSGFKPYPLLSDLESLINNLGSPPVRSDYDTYDKYKTALDVYNAKLTIIHDYEWYDNSNNHFTAVEFRDSTSRIASSTEVYIGKVVTRNGAVYSIDTTGVDDLQNLSSEIRYLAEKAIAGHQHGGNDPYDPPKIRLQTDIRRCVLSDYNPTNGIASYSVLTSSETGRTLGHLHSYKIDSNGDGNTVDQVGTGIVKHFHKISGSVVGIPEGSSEFIADHTHDITSVVSDPNTWTASNQFVVYVNDNEFATETSTFVETYPSNNKLVVNGGVSVQQNTYSSSFQIFGETYTYTGKGYTTYQFMFRMMLDFYAEYSGKFNEIYTQLQNAGDIQAGVTELVWDRQSDDPFWFWIDTDETNIDGTNPLTDNNDAVQEETIVFTDGTSVTVNAVPLNTVGDNIAVGGFTQLKNQCESANALMSKVGDSFVFVPNGADNITVDLVEIGASDSVKIEILGNAEVTGTLRSESIFYINANKFLLGKFDIARIPFVSHIGRIFEEFLPFQHSILTNDGFRYKVSPTVTDSNLNHYHRMSLDDNGDGSTTDTMIAGDVVYYATDAEGDTVLIAHHHPVQEYVIDKTSQSGLALWNGISSSEHTHNTVFPLRGNDKTVYSLMEDVDGNLFTGTSDGYLMIPSLSSYLFVINGYDYYEFGNDLWTLFLNAKNLYEQESGFVFNATSEIYGSQISKAEEDLVKDGDSVIVYGEVVPNVSRDKTLIKRVSDFKLPNFKYVIAKDSDEVLDTETVIGTKTVVIATGKEVDLADWTTADETANPTKELDIVERNFNDVPIWSQASNTITVPSEAYVSATSQIDTLVVGSNIIAKNVNLNQGVNTVWSYVETPFTVGISRDIIKASDGSYWLSSDAGVLVSRSYSEGLLFEQVELPGSNPDVLGIVESSPGRMAIASFAGIFDTSNGGKTWILRKDVIGGFKKLVRDYGVDKSSVVSGHYHQVGIDSLGNGFLEESIGVGTPHVHQVSEWTIGVTLGHTHTIVSTLYAVDNVGLIYRSIDTGITWTQYGVLPSGDYGSFIAAFGKLLVAKSDALYVSIDGSNWSKALSETIYSFAWDYKVQNLMIGGNNVVYETSDSSSFVLRHRFYGNPLSMFVQGGVRQYFGYAYSNQAKEFHFYESPSVTNSSLALIDFNKWFADNGVWDSNVPYDIYINNKLVLSTKFNVDRRVSSGYYFTISPSDALIDFSATTSLTSEVTFGDFIIEVASSSGFVVGDDILIESSFDLGDLPTQSTSETDEEYQDRLNEYYRDAQALEESATFAVIGSIAGNKITVTSRLPRDINMPATVNKVEDLNGDSSILVSIYESILSNIGTLTHDQVEDGLSNYSDGRPYKFNDTYLSNLLQLTQAVRYVYPDINSEFINDMFYDFRYKSATNPTYPDITDFIDVLTSRIYSQKFYDSEFSRQFAKSVNKILIGYGNFVGNIIVATDIGIFWAKSFSNMEGNWFYISQLPYQVYDLTIFNDKMMAATSKGVYSSVDMETWSVEVVSFTDLPAYSFGLRWEEESNIVSVPSHNATFVSEVDSSDDDGWGTITAISGTPYNVLLKNKAIKITNAGDKNGDYIIEQITDAGAGYGSSMRVSRSFEGPDETKSGISIVMGSWWVQWDGDLNTSNSNITNTMLIGGKGKIVYSVSDSGGKTGWGESDIEVSDFIGKEFITLSNGLILLVAPGINPLTLINYILDSSNVGSSWGIFNSFEGVIADITNVEISDDNNTLLTVSYVNPPDYIYVDGVLTGNQMAIFNTGSSVFSGKVIWNETKLGLDYIRVFGNKAAEYANGNRIVVYPIKINTGLETSWKTLLLGGNNGIYTDKNTAISNNQPTGTLNNVGYSGVVSRIDISGSVVSANVNPVSRNTVFSVESDTVIRTNELIGKTVYITDADPIEEYTIVANNALTVGGETTIEINKLITSNYSGKKFTIVGSSSKVYINYDLPVLVNQFNSGTLYVMSDENSNIGSTYDIKFNTDSYVELEVAIIPSSTFSTASSDDVLKVGQRISLVDSTGNIVLWVTLDRQPRENSLKELNVAFMDSSSIASELESIPILSNTQNSLVVDSSVLTTELNSIKTASLTAGVSADSLYNLAPVYIFNDGDSFRLDGLLIESLSGFANKKTSIDSGHLHSADMINDVVTGDIQSFPFNNASYVDIIVGNTTNFNSSIVQKRGDLFENAKIVFTNQESYNLRYETEVISHTATTIRVRIQDSNNWNFTAYDMLNISVGWNWRIDSYNYGYSVGIEYNNFIVKNSFVNQQIERGDTDIVIEDTIGIVVGDTVKIQDDTLSFELGTVDSIIDGETLRLDAGISRTFYISSNPQLRVLRNSFSNTHEHQIRNNEVELLYISSYLNNGYPSEHAHRVLPLIADVTKVLNRSGEIIAVGSSSDIYSSVDNGATWEQIVDLNYFNENDIIIKSISTATLKDGGIVAGATNGRIFVEGISNGTVVPLQSPSVTGL